MDFVDWRSDIYGLQVQRKRTLELWGKVSSNTWIREKARCLSASLTEGIALGDFILETSIETGVSDLLGYWTR